MIGTTIVVGIFGISAVGPEETVIDWYDSSWSLGISAVGPEETDIDWYHWAISCVGPEETAIVLSAVGPEETDIDWYDNLSWLANSELLWFLALVA